MIINCTTIYYNENGEQHTLECSRPMYKKGFTNLDKVNWDGVSYVIALRDIHTHTSTVIQASGYIAERGMFVDTYPSDEG